MADGTTGIFLTSLTRPESKMKLSEKKEPLADRAGDGHDENAVKGGWPVAKRGMAKNWQDPFRGKPLSSSLSVCRTVLGGKSFLPGEAACQEAAHLWRPLEKWMCLDSCPTLWKTMRRKDPQRGTGLRDGEHPGG